MRQTLPYVGAFITLTSLQVWELAVERWLLLNLPFLAVLIHRVVRRHIPPLFLLLAFLSPILATALLAFGPSYVIADTRVPEPATTQAALYWSFLTAIITGVGGLTVVMTIGASRSRRLVAWVVAFICTVGSLLLLLPHPYRLLYVPWSLQRTYRELVYPRQP